MSESLSNLTKKVGKPPGTPIYTGQRKLDKTHLRVVTYAPEKIQDISGDHLAAVLPDKPEEGVTWVNVEGLHDVDLINEVANRYNIHPLVVEDILNVNQRPKVEEFEDYCFISLKILRWQDEGTDNICSDQFSIVFGKNFVLSFAENENHIFDSIYQSLQVNAGRLRQHGSDYLTYRLIDTIVDQYFIVLEKLSEQLEHLEDTIISYPTPKNSRTIYRLKRRLLILRKAIWPMREAINRLQHSELEFITPFTSIYLRDVYDHTVQAIDTLESFRDMLSGLLDVYLMSVSNRMNEIMKVLTIIATIFIPITFVASLYGMNFKHMPELNWRWGYPAVLLVMLSIVVSMLLYFRHRKWI